MSWVGVVWQSAGTVHGAPWPPGWQTPVVQSMPAGLLVTLPPGVPLTVTVILAAVQVEEAGTTALFPAASLAVMTMLLSPWIRGEARTDQPEPVTDAGCSGPPLS